MPGRAVSKRSGCDAVLEGSAGSSLEPDELDEVVGEHAVGAPGAGAGVAAQSGATPRPVAFAVGDASFASGSPLDRFDEVVGVLDAGSHRGGLACLPPTPPTPHLAKKHGRWLLHHHSADAALVPMATAICAEAMARIIAAGAGSRFGTCDSDGCDRVFLDGSKNGSRRFCSTICQNRIKAAALRRRHAERDE